jgi:hypothetical protein
LQKGGDSVVAIYGRKSDDPKRTTEKWTNGFIITMLDHHASATYTIDSIEESGVTLSYETSFDHRSFGKNLITKDRGTFRLPWLSTDFLYYAGTQPELPVKLLPSSKAKPEDIARVAETAKRFFNQVCAVKTEIWPEPVAISELAYVWHVDFLAKDRVIILNGQQITVKPGHGDGMKIALMKPDLTCTLLGDPITTPKANQILQQTATNE